MRIHQTNFTLIIKLGRVLDPESEPRVEQRADAAVAIETPGQLRAAYVMEHDNVGFKLDFMFFNVETPQHVIFKPDRSSIEVDTQCFAFVAEFEEILTLVAPVFVFRI
jgi:hypothetical protein